MLALSAVGVLTVAAQAEPPQIGAKRAQAQQVLAQVQELDSRLEKTVEAYNYARLRLEGTERSLKVNGFRLSVATRNLSLGRQRIAARLVQLYENPAGDSFLETVLGANGLGDLIDRIDTANRIAEQDTRVLAEVSRFNRTIRVQRAKLNRARIQQRELTAELESQQQSVQSQIGERQRLLSSIRGEIAQLQAEERARQARLKVEAERRFAAQRAAAQRAAALARQQVDSHPATENAAAPIVGASAVTPEGISVAPPSRYQGVVGIAMQYLGVPYVWGGASPSGFDCSGFILYVYAQVGVSLPHYAASQYTYGVPVSKDQLEPGDLVFFDGLGHNGMYIGGGEFIHAPHTGDVVKISSLSEPWYAANWVGARRLL